MLKRIRSLGTATAVAVAVVGVTSLAYEARETTPGVEPRIVFATGRNTHGQLGLGNEKTQMKPQRVKALDGEPMSLGAVAAGGYLSAAVSATDGVLTWGSGREFALGHDDDINESQPRVVMDDTFADATESDPVTQVAVGGAHMLAVTRAGVVWSWGSGWGGRLGHGDDNNQKTPKRVETLKDEVVVAVAASRDHSLALTESSKVYMWGNKRTGRLGLGVGQDSYGVKENADTAPVEVDVGRVRGAVVRIATGASGQHALVTDSGSLYMFGDNGYGQLGSGRIDVEAEPVPRMVRALRGHRVVAVALGAFHTVALTDEGRVFTWGVGRQGQLGHGDSSDCLTPKIVEALKDVRVIKVAAGASHTVVLAKDGKVYAFGKNSEGQLGLDDIGYRMAPERVVSLRGVRIRDVVCGAEHTLFVANEEK